MTPKEQNDRAAKIVGWKPTTDGGICWDADGKAVVTSPNYFGDLNECHKLETAMLLHWIGPYYGWQDPYERNSFICYATITDAWMSWFVRGMETSENFAKAIHAEPARRLEIVLRTVGEWEEEN